MRSSTSGCPSKLPRCAPASQAAALLATALLLAACGVGPVQPPQLQVSLSDSFRQATEQSATTADGAWWARFGDATLTALIEQALGANHDIASALDRVREARAGSDAQASRLLPKIDLQGSALDLRSDLPRAVKQGQPDTRAYRGSVDLAWEIDLAGGVRAARDAARADAQAAAARVAGARLLVASEVARQYFTLRSAEERLRIVEALVQAQRDTARLVDSRQREGQASAFDLDRACAEADAFAAQLPPLRTLVGVSQTRLAVLLGANPSQPVAASEAAFTWPAAPQIGTGQPSELLKRRPDLMAAEARYAAETLRGAEARAQWWPKLFASALLGREDLRLNALDLAPVRFSSVALAFTAPLFNAGRIDAGIQAQSARADEALHAWQKSVLVAVQEVEDSLLARAQEQERGSALEATLAHRRRSLQRAESLVREGQIDLLALLDVQRSVLAGELALSESRLQQALDSVQLYKALGGAYGAQNEPAAVAAASPALTSERTAP